MLGVIVNGGHPLSFLFSCKPVSQHQVIVSNTTSSENGSIYTVSQASLLATELSWCRASFKIKKTTPVILPHQELTPGIFQTEKLAPGILPNHELTPPPPAPFQIEKLTPDIFPNLEIDPRHPSESRNWPRAFFRIKKLTSGILTNQEIDPLTFFQIEKLTPGSLSNREIDPGHPFKSMNWPRATFSKSRSWPPSIHPNQGIGRGHPSDFPMRESAPGVHKPLHATISGRTRTRGMAQVLQVAMSSFGIWFLLPCSVKTSYLNAGRRITLIWNQGLWKMIAKSVLQIPEHLHSNKLFVLLSVME